MSKPRWDIIVIGCSAGGLKAIETIFAKIPAEYPTPIILVQHVSTDPKVTLASFLQAHLPHNIVEARNEQKIAQNCIYVAPSGYHLLVEDDHRFSLCAGEQVSYARPSIDVLFSSVAEVYGEHLLGIVLTGANRDGTKGAKAIKACGGMVIAQDPAKAEVDTMPKSVIHGGFADYVLSLDEIAKFLLENGMQDGATV